MAPTKSTVSGYSYQKDIKLKTLCPPRVHHYECTNDSCHLHVFRAISCKSTNEDVSYCDSIRFIGDGAVLEHCGRGIFEM